MTLLIIFELVLYFLCVYTVMKNIYGYPPRNNRLICVLLLIYIPFIIADFLIERDISSFVLIILIAADIAFLKLIFPSGRFRSVLCTFIVLYSVNITLSSITVFILNLSENGRFKEILGVILNCLFVIICTVVCVLRHSYFQARFKLIPKNVKRIAMISLTASSLAVSLVSDYSMVQNIGRWEFGIRITLVILVITVGSAFPVMISNSIGKSFYTKQAKNFEHQIEVQAGYYKDLSESNYELRRFKHDYKNMRIGVTKCIRDGNIKEAEKILSDCDSSLNQTTQTLFKFDTGNGIVDAILSEKQKKAAAVNAEIVFSGAVCASAIDATDLCVIFGNTLDNAVEACAKAEPEKEKEISVICKSMGGFMYLEIVNPVIENIEIKNNRLQTTKQDKENHGFGIYSLQKTVDKYNGTLSFSCVDKQFKVELMLELQ